MIGLDLGVKKTCPRCGIPKDPSLDFYKDLRNGMERGICIPCWNEESAKNKKLARERKINGTGN